MRDRNNSVIAKLLVDERLNLDVRFGVDAIWAIGQHPDPKEMTDRKCGLGGEETYLLVASSITNTLPSSFLRRALAMLKSCLDPWLR